MQNLATLRDLEDFGPAGAMPAIPVARRKRVLRAVSGHFLTYLRKRGAPPLAVSLEDEPTAALTLGATFTQTGTPTKVLAVAIRFAAGGTVGTPGITYQLSIDGGATFAAAAALPLSGQVLVDGVTTTLAGNVAEDDELVYSSQVEEELGLHVAGMASWILLRNRGLDPAVEQELRESYDAAKAWLGDEAQGLAELDAGADTTPELDEGGPLADTRVSPYSWVRHGRGWEDE